MVRSPFKIISGLMSRLKTADRDQTNPPADPNSKDGIETALSRPEQTVREDMAEPADRQAETAKTPLRRPGKGASEFSTPPISADVPSAEADNPDPLLPSAASKEEPAGNVSDGLMSATSPAPATTSLRDLRPRRKEAASARDRQASADVPTAGRISETDRIRALDEEISSLRAELATRLRQQNDQLRRMLKRFEPR